MNVILNGFFIQQAILIGLPHTARCDEQEIFGPVCHISHFYLEDEVINLVNNIEYGLSADILAASLSRVHRAAKQIDTGIV